MNICSTTTTTITSGVSDRYSYPVHDMADSFLRAALVKAQEETDPVEICRLFYTLHSFLSSWTKTFQLESSSSSGTNRRHYYDQPREHVSCNGDDQTNKQSFSLLAVSTTPNHVPVRRQLSFQDLLVVSTPRQQCRDWMTLHLHASTNMWRPSLASLLSEELEAIFGRTHNSRGLGNQVRQLFGASQI